MVVCRGGLYATAAASYSLFLSYCELFLAVVDHGLPVANLVHDGLESVLEGLAAKVDNLATRHAIVLTVVELVGILAGRESNVTSGEEEDPVALTVFAEIETARPLEVREVLESNLKTKCRGEGNAYIDCGLTEETWSRSCSPACWV